MPRDHLSVVVVAATVPAPSLFTPLQQAPERTEIEVQILVAQSELRLELLHTLGETHEGEPEPLDLLVGEVPLIHAAQSLPFHELTEQLDQRQHELSKAAFDLLRVGRHALRERIRQLVEPAGHTLDVSLRCEDPVE